MLHTPIPVQSNQLPKLAAVLELFKPVTWFAAMWAFMCGAVSSGQPFFGNMHLLLGGMLLDTFVATLFIPSFFHLLSGRKEKAVVQP